MAKQENERSRVDRLLARFTNSRILAPVIVVALIAIGIANFTDALSKLKDFINPRVGPVFTASAGGPIFVMPKINGRTIDGCVLTAKVAGSRDNDPNACNAPAQMSIASEFCKVARYSRATTFDAKDTGAFQKSYKMAQTLAPDGHLDNVWNEDNGGGFIFVSITCEK